MSGVGHSNDFQIPVRHCVIVCGHDQAVDGPPFDDPQISVPGRDVLPILG